MKRSRGHLNTKLALFVASLACFSLANFGLVNLGLANLSLVNQAMAQSPAATSEGSGSPLANVSGSGSTNYVPVWTSGTALGNSGIYQAGGRVGIGTTSPKWALDVAGHINSASGYLIGEELVLTFPGGISGENIALGFGALLNNSSGTFNTALGENALLQNTTGSNNTATGASALGVSTGSENTATGANALAGNTSGSENTAIGLDALSNNTTGTNNTAVGFVAGSNVTVGSNNIHIGNPGLSSDSGVIRIGSLSQTSFFVTGVRGVTTGGDDAVPVVIDSGGQMGTVNSSRRFKEDIRDMGEASQGLMRLRPVTFRYQKPFADGSKPMQYGLIAEEVADVYPDLVAHSSDGQIETVKYQVLDSMLLNEVQRQQAEIQELEKRLKRLEAQLAAVSRTSQVGQ